MSLYAARGGGVAGSSKELNKEAIGVRKPGRPLQGLLSEQKGKMHITQPNRVEMSGPM
jgi:hypothetical protein